MPMPTFCSLHVLMLASSHLIKICMTVQVNLGDHQMMMKKEIRKIVSGMQNGGDFCCAGSSSMPIPGLRIDPVGDIAFPLLPVQAQAIKTIAIQAPYGKGPETIVDLSVRNTLQIEPSKVSFTNPEWDDALSNLMNKACIALGIDFSDVQPALYKVLLYEKGGHFKAHKDSEKQDGMFGTFVLQFPSAHTGGECVVKHCNMQREFTLGTNDASCAQKYHYMAHYADCEHEIKEIKDGFRLVAVYSLCWRGNCSAPSPPLMAPISKVSELMTQVDGSLAIMLKHQYSDHSLGTMGFRSLKGIDRAITGTLMAASNMMAAKNPDDELIFHVIQATRVCVEIEHNLEYYDNFPNPKVEKKYYGPDGWTTGDNYRHFCFYEDVVNHRFKEGLFEDLFVGLQDDASPDTVADSDVIDVWWRDNGRTEDYMGNEGSELQYECFVLVFYRKAMNLRR